MAETEINFHKKLLAYYFYTLSKLNPFIWHPVLNIFKIRNLIDAVQYTGKNIR